MYLFNLEKYFSGGPFLLPSFLGGENFQSFKTPAQNLTKEYLLFIL